MQLPAHTVVWLGAVPVCALESADGSGRVRISSLTAVAFFTVFHPQGVAILTKLLAVSMLGTANIYVPDFWFLLSSSRHPRLPKSYQPTSDHSITSVTPFISTSFRGFKAQLDLPAHYRSSKVWWTFLSAFTTSLDGWPLPKCRSTGSTPLHAFSLRQRSYFLEAYIFIFCFRSQTDSSPPVDTTIT
jgi:hypothetical protein